MNSGEVSVYGVGDVVLEWPNPEPLFELVQPTLKEADILFGQLEAGLSDKGEPQLQNYSKKKITPDRVSALTYAGFDVMSLAGNHHLDRGDAAFFETIETLTKNNIAPIGVGRNIDEARKPLILERKGVKVAFLGYCSVVPKGYEARADKSGCVPMRASTSYEPVDWQPGTAPRIITIANKDDLAAMVDDIKKVRPLADVVIMSIHWGIHWVPAVIAMYQKEVAHAAIDAGVDLILGHHCHILKGMEVYKGKAIFYDLCNFIRPSKPHDNLTRVMANVKVDPTARNYAFAPDSRKTIIAKCVISDKKIKRVSFLPVFVNGDAQPEVMRRDDQRFEDVMNYMKEITESQGLNAKYKIEGEEVVVSD